MIYFARLEEGGPIKIGTTINLHERILAHQRVFGESFSVFAVMEGGPEEEKDLHVRFENLKIGEMGREWFKPDADLEIFIGRYAEPWEMQPRKRPRKQQYVSTNNFVAFRGTEEYKEWVQWFAEQQGCSVIHLIEVALDDRAKSLGYETPQPPRLG